MERYAMLLDYKNQYSENEFTSQSNLWIQCNTSKTTNEIFHRTSKNNFTMCMETKKAMNSESNLEKMNGTGRINLPDFRLNYKATGIKAVWY